MQGNSLLPLIKGRAFPKYDIFVEDIQSKDKLKQIALRTDDWKLIYRYTTDEGQYELFNLKEDPGELVNLINVEKQKFISLKDKLDKWIGNMPPMAKPVRLIDDKAKEKLKSFGYIE
jgi:arylsulfatase A-like enzyme